MSGIAVAAANTKVYNNTFVNKTGANVQAAWIWDDRREAPDKGETWPYWSPRVDLGPNTNNTHFANNLLVAQQPNGARLLNFMDAENVAPNTQSNDYFSVLNRNVYYTLSNQNLYGWADTQGIKTAAELRTLSGQNWETTSVHVVGSGDPFVNRAGMNFALRGDSVPATTNGLALPSDVAAATGLPSTPKIGANFSQLPL
jgi:hypothetical protein